MKVSILMLTHNAPKYVKTSIESVKELTKGVDYELIVVDNRSHIRTKWLLNNMKKKGLIDVLYFNKENSLFAKGNNIASTLASKNSDYILLLNSDIKIHSENWLKKLVEIHPKQGGISAYGTVDNEPVRADGYCMLINKNIYDYYKLDEQFAWFWSVTKLESQVLKEGKTVRSVRNHEKYIHHFGGKSGKAFKYASGMGINIEEVKQWFRTGHVEVLDDIDE